MGGRGPAPKDPTERRRRNAAPELAVVVPDDQVRGPELPAGYEWPDETLAWWQHWRESPQAQTFIATDWSFLLDTALIHAEFWLGDRSRGAELRLRVAKFGATGEDRRRLKLAVGEPPARLSRVRVHGRPGNRKARLLRAADEETARLNR
jgi:hypothetical protein